MSNGNLENIKIIYGNTTVPISSVPKDFPMKDFLAWAINKLELPAQDGEGNIYKYSLMIRETKEMLNVNESISESSLAENDEIEIVRTIQSSPLSMSSESAIEIISSSEIEKEVSMERETLRAIERLGNKVVDNFDDASERRYKLRDAEIGITRYLLIVFAVALLASLFFTFYLIIVDKLTPVGNFLYPIISLILGFFSGYFAGGSGKDLKKN